MRQHDDGPRAMPWAADPVRPSAPSPITIEVAGERIGAVEGQTIAGALLASGRSAWRSTSRNGRPRGVFCGIGVCFDCLVEVNGLRDVRACQRRAEDGDIVRHQNDSRPGPGTEAGND